MPAAAASAPSAGPSRPSGEAAAAADGRAAAQDFPPAAPGAAETPAPAAAADADAGAAETAAPAPRQPPHPQAIAAGAAQQLAVALNRGADGVVEIALDPAELGPVRVGLSGGDGAILVHVAADRPETLDLFRRHADLLARDLREAGYGDVSFDFGSGTSGRDPRGGPAHAQAGAAARAGAYADPGAAAAAAPPSAAAAATRPAGRAGGLDLRL